VADAILKAMVSVKGAAIVCLLDSYHSNLRVAQRPDPSAVAKAPENLVVRFAEAVDGYPLPKGTPEAASPIRLPHPGPAPHEKHCRWVRTYYIAMIASAISHISLTIG